MDMNNQNVLITDWLSPDERYCIFLDELYDIREKKLIGNIWENFENFKFFVRYSTSVSDLSASVKESIYGSLNKMVISESVSENLKRFINENIFNDFVDWAKETGKSTVSGLRDFINTSVEGAGEVLDKISNAELKDAFEIIGKGIFYFLKKLRDALYHPVGLIIDAILVASGIGKTLQWIPWALVVGLDIYEIFSGDYEESFFEKLLLTLFDVVALVTTGAIAKSLRITLKGVTKVDDLAKVVSQNKNVREIFQKIPSYLKKVSPMLERAINYLSKRFPKGANFLKGILSKVDRFINTVLTEFKKLFTKKTAVAAVSTTGVMFGLDKVLDNMSKTGEIGLTDEEVDELINSGEIDMDVF